VADPQRITSPYAPDLGEVRAFLERMIRWLHFVELVAAIIAFVAKVCEVNGELSKKLAAQRRGRPRSEVLERLERQLVLPLAALGGEPARRPTKPPREKKSRKGRHPGRAALPAHLPRVDVPNPVPPELRGCPLCGAEMTTVGHSRCESLSVIPARVVVEVRVDETVACPNDDTIVSAPTPPAIVERGKLSDTLIVEATADKYIEHTPIERQCARFAQLGVDIAPQTLGRSVAEHLDLLAPVATLIEEKTRGPGLLGTDATGIPILDDRTVDGIRTGAMWAWTNARWVTFFYSPSADSDSVRAFLGDALARTVQCDGTNTLSFLERAGGARPGCWSHGRRRLVDAARGGDQIALEGLHKIARLFAVERASRLAGETADERRLRRQRETRPVLDDLRAWLDDKRAVVPPKTPLGRALGYLHRQWKRLLLFLDDGNIDATNNRRERELRRLVLGRKKLAVHLARHRRRAHRDRLDDHRDLRRPRRQPPCLSPPGDAAARARLAEEPDPRAPPRSDRRRTSRAHRWRARRAAARRLIETDRFRHGRLHRASLDGAGCRSTCTRFRQATREGAARRTDRAAEPARDRRPRVAVRAQRGDALGRRSALAERAPESLARAPGRR
jgi:transposase